MTENADVRACFEAGRAAWPALRLDEGAFVAHVERLAAKSGPPKPEHAADLYLACACALGIKGAVQAFDAHFGEVLRRAVSRVDRSDSSAEEVLQTLKVKLFVTAPPKIAAYAGRAKLSSWLTTAAVRTALNMRTPSGRKEEELETGHAIGRTSPELAYVRTRYKKEFQDAVRGALARLTDKQRTILRLHLGEHMSVDRLATVYRVGRSTTGRWLIEARTALLEGVRTALEDRLGLTSSELRSIGADVRSDLELSLVKLLGDDAGPD